VSRGCAPQTPRARASTCFVVGSREMPFGRAHSHQWVLHRLHTAVLSQQTVRTASVDRIGIRNLMIRIQ